MLEGYCRRWLALFMALYSFKWGQTDVAANMGIRPPRRTVISDRAELSIRNSWQARDPVGAILA